MSAAESERWLRYAAEDLVTAEALLGRADAYPRHACWLAQQAAEKAIKAALIFSGIEFPYSHDLDRLRDLLPEGWQVRRTHADLAELTQWAIEARYPGDSPDPLWPEARVAARQARSLYDVLQADMGKRRLGESTQPPPPN